MKVIAILLLTMWLNVAQSGIITVNKVTDNNNSSDGGCDLREAVKAANTDAAVDGCTAGNAVDIVIIDVNGSIQLTSQINVTSSMAIRAPFGADEPVLIQAANNHRIFEVYPIQSSGHIFEFIGLHLTNGDTANGSGGAIYVHNNGTNGLTSQVFISESVFENNEGSFGGAISIEGVNATGKITIRDSIFVGNQANEDGGAIYLSEGTAGEFTLLNNRFQNNVSAGTGGAILVADTGSEDFSINHNQFYHNLSEESGGGMAIFATAAVQNYIFNRNAFIGNTASSSGGALYVALDAQAWVYNSVMAHNVADRGGALSSSGGNGQNAWLYIYHSTLAHNTASLGGNIYAYGGTLGSIGASILAYPQGGSNCSGSTSILNTARTIIDDTSCPFSPTTDRREDPLLSGISFDDAGFPALTPTTDSSAIDGVPLSACLFYGGGDLEKDQQNNPRPMDGDGDNNSMCDIGAIEVPEDHDLLWSDGFGG